MKKWSELSSKQKSNLVFRIVLWIVAILLIIFTLFAVQIFGEGSVFGKVFDDDRGGFAMLGDWINNQIPVILKSIIYMIIAIIISKILRVLISKLLLLGKRGITAANMIESFIKYFTAIAIILMVLLIFGVDPVALFASVGILGLVIGLGAQSLISDIISGLFIVFEGEYQVGDYIVIDGFRGKVEAIGIRTTKFVDYGGNIKSINNSEIKTVVNLSSAPSMAVSEIPIKSEDFQKAEALIASHMDKLRKSLPRYTEGIKYVGPSAFTKEGMILKFCGFVDETYRFQAERDLNRELRNLFDQNNILHPYPKVVFTKDEPYQRY